MNNTAMESYEHLDFAGLKNEGSRAKMTSTIDPPVVGSSPHLVLLLIIIHQNGPRNLTCDKYVDLKDTEDE